MSQTIELHLPWPPSVNHIYGSGAKGQRFLLPKVEAYRMGVLVACQRQGARRPLLRGRLAVDVEVYQPVRTKRVDIGNLDKALMDALTAAGVWVDDEQIDDVHYRRCAPENGGAVVVRIREIKSSGGE